MAKQVPWAKPKYRNKPTYVNGRRYASKAEAARAEEHVLLTQRLSTHFAIPQVRIMVGESLPYTFDFLVYNGDGKIWAEDVKGMEKQRDRDIQRLWAAGHGLPIPLVILKRKGGKWERKVIEPKLGC